MLIVQIAFLPLVVILANKIGKARVFMLSAAVWIGGAALLGFFGPTWPSFTIYVVAAVIGMGLCGCVVMPWTMFPDVTDVGELYFGERKSGSFSGIMTFVRKSSSAFGIFIVSQILNFSGYIKPETIDGKEVLFDQPESLITALKVIVFAIPVVLLLITLFFARKYPLSQEVHDKLRKLLEFKRGETESSELSEEEAKSLTDLLI
jgi:Na+/melibiose symporter-like transporter